METRVVDDENNPVPTGEVGEIVHRSPHACLGYCNDEEKTAAAFADGWFHSGDLGIIDADGYLSVVDRKKDMIKTGGENVASREVEEAIYQLDGVAEVAVVGLPDADLGQRIVAYVVGSAAPDELIAYVAEQLSAHKRPREVRIVPGLPRNAMGKVLKKELASWD